MILQKLSITPNPLFEPIIFKNGINYIFGKKEVGPNGETGKSLNGIGKSMVLELINFCLLSDFNKYRSPRLYTAFIKVPLSGMAVQLDFDINNINYSIIRSFDTPSEIMFSHHNRAYSNYNTDDAKKFLCRLVFARSNYDGFLNPKWLRKLLPFYIKIQNADKTPFSNPVKYMLNAVEMELIQYHFFLLNLDNYLPSRYFDLNQESNSLLALIRKARKILTEVYGTRNKKHLKANRNKLIVDIDRLKSAINSFHLSDKYKLDKEAADKLTAQIKNHWFLIANDELKIQTMQESLKVSNVVKVETVTNIYEELNEILGQQLKKTLSEAIEFRKSLVSSRKEFIKKEVTRLKKQIEKKNLDLTELENKRSELLRILEEKEAFSDLRDAYNKLNAKQEELNELDSQNKLINDLESKQTIIKKAIVEIRDEVKNLKEQIKIKEIDFASIISNVYDNLYPQHNECNLFEIVTNPTNKSLIKLNILENAEQHSNGKNQGRTLIYDLAVLFNSIYNNLNSPRFLIHDGVMDGFDKTHFIELVKFLEKKSAEGYKFQYIITLNEEGTLKDAFTNGDLVTPDRISKEAIINLTPYKTLFGFDYV